MANITVSYKGLTGKQGSITIDNAQTLDSLISSIASAESISQTNYYNISLMRNFSVNSITYSDSSSTLSSLGIATGDSILCTPNQNGSKQERQIQKLDISAAARSADGLRAVYDIASLPTAYSGNTVSDNSNTGGLVVGRPWPSPTLFSGLAIWYDTALASTINGGTFSDGTTVTALTNRATGTNGAAGSTGREPTVQNGAGDTLNGYPVVRFATATTYDNIRFTTNSFDDATGWTVVMLAKIVSTVGFNPALFMVTDSAQSSITGVRYFSNSAFVFYTPVGTATVNNGIDPDGTWKIISMRYDSTAAAAGRCTFRWAKANVSVTNGGTPPSGTVPTTATYVETMSAWDGDLAEQVAYNRALSDAEIIALENYLSSKWGV